MQETQVQSLCREDPLEEEMTNHSSILAWEVPWTEELGRLQSMGVQRDLTERTSTVLHSNNCHRQEPRTTGTKVEVLVTQGVQLFASPQTVAHQPPLSMGLPRQENWSQSPFPPPGDLPDPGIEPRSPALADGFFTTEPAGKLISTTSSLD